jgi:hypothetical protein
MNYTLFLTGIYAGFMGFTVHGMDVATEVAEFARAPQGNGINVHNAAVAIQRAQVNHNHVAGEHRYNFHNGQEFNQGEPCLRQFLHALLGGIKQTFFDIGNSGGRFTDYMTKVGASIVVGFSVELLKNSWDHLFNKQALAEQVYNKKLALLAAQEAMVNSLANQLRVLPRATEAEKKNYAILYEQYVTILKSFAGNLKDLVLENSQCKPA